MTEVDRSLRLLSRGRRNLLSFHDEDHLDPPATDLATDVREHLRTYGVDPTGWRITMVANARVLGYVFDPASFYLCRDRSGPSASSWSRSTTPTASGTSIRCMARPT